MRSPSWLFTDLQVLKLLSGVGFRHKYAQVFKHWSLVSVRGLKNHNLALTDRTHGGSSATVAMCILCYLSSGPLARLMIWCASDSVSQRRKNNGGLLRHLTGKMTLVFLGSWKSGDSRSVAHGLGNVTVYPADVRVCSRVFELYHESN
jgi:hypothetical protein